MDAPLEAAANEILRSAGAAGLAAHPDHIPTTDALAHSIRAGATLAEFRPARLEDDYGEESRP